MVAGCPKCNSRYRVDVEKIGPDGAKLRCTKCSAVFLVRAPQASSEPPAPAPDPTPSSGQEVNSKRTVLVADPDESRGKVTAEAIEGWGLTPILVHDGVEAMLAIQRSLPALIILDAALPKMFGFQVCEIVKRNESLSDTHVVLVGSIHQQDRYRREPSNLYGADSYLEVPDLPEGLLPLLRDAGLQVRVADTQVPTDPVPTPDPISAQAPDPSPEVVSAEAPAPTPATVPVVEPEDPERSAERERAQRLARIAVSEMVLYQPDKFDEAARAGNLEQALDLEIQEARALLRQRISEDVRAETDFIIDELGRVAKERGQ